MNLICARLVLFICLIICSVYSSYGQYTMGGDYKKTLFKSIKPSEKSTPNITSREFKSKSVETAIDNKYLNSYSNYKYNRLGHLMEITEPKYKLNPNLTKYNGTTPLNQLAPGSTQVVFMGGHFHHISTAGTNVVPSGISFGGGRKKLSQKSKDILINVLGMEIDE